MSNDNPLSSSEHLLKRFDRDVQAVYNQMQVLEIVFNNLRGSWLAISQAHKVFKIENEGEL